MLQRFRIKYLSKDSRDILPLSKLSTSNKETLRVNFLNL